MYNELFFAFFGFRINKSQQFVEAAGIGRCGKNCWVTIGKGTVFRGQKINDIGLEGDLNGINDAES